MTPLRLIILLLCLSCASVASAQHYVTFGHDPNLKAVNGKSAGSVISNWKRGVTGLQRALAGTPYAFAPAGSYHPQVYYSVVDLRSTSHRYEFAYNDRRGHVYINQYPLSSSTGKIFVWNDATLASIAAHETLHSLAPSLSHAQMKPYDDRTRAMMPKVGEKLPAWPLR